MYWRHDWTARPLGVWLAAVGAVLIIMGAAAPIDTDETSYWMTKTDRDDTPQQLEKL